MKVGSIWCNMSFVWKYCLNLERTSSQLLSDWSRHCCQASSLVLQECVDQSERLTDCSKKMWQNRRRFCHGVRPALPTAAGAVSAVETLLIIVVSGQCHVGGGTKHVCIYVLLLNVKYYQYYQCFSEYCDLPWNFFDTFTSWWYVTGQGKNGAGTEDTIHHPASTTTDEYRATSCHSWLVFPRVSVCNIGHRHLFPHKIT